MRLMSFRHVFSKVAETSLSNPAAVLILSFFFNPALLLDGDARSSLYSGLVRFRMQISASVLSDEELVEAS